MVEPYPGHGGDSLSGRDTGSEGYRKAAAYVVQQFRRAGLKPAGENGDWYQPVKLHVVRSRTDQSEVSLVYRDRSVTRSDGFSRSRYPPGKAARRACTRPFYSRAPVRPTIPN
jgi:hypothetical protein